MNLTLQGWRPVRQPLDAASDPAAAGREPGGGRGGHTRPGGGCLHRAVHWPGELPSQIVGVGA